MVDLLVMNKQNMFSGSVDGHVGWKHSCSSCYPDSDCQSCQLGGKTNPGLSTHSLMFSCLPHAWFPLISNEGEVESVTLWIDSHMPKTKLILKLCCCCTSDLSPFTRALCSHGENQNSFTDPRGESDGARLGTNDFPYFTETILPVFRVLLWWETSRFCQVVFMDILVTSKNLLSSKKQKTKCDR